MKQRFTVVSLTDTQGCGVTSAAKSRPTTGKSLSLGEREESQLTVPLGPARDLRRKETVKGRQLTENK